MKIMVILRAVKLVRNQLEGLCRLAIIKQDLYLIFL